MIARLLAEAGQQRMARLFHLAVFQCVFFEKGLYFLIAGLRMLILKALFQLDVILLFPVGIDGIRPILL